MTLLAGVFSRRHDTDVPASVCEAIKRALSRRPDECVTEFRDGRVYLAKLDINAYGEPAYRVDPCGSVTMLAGEPILGCDNEGANAGRSHDLQVLHQSWDREDWSVLQGTQGLFSAVYYRPKPATLSLITDKLGVRRLYYWAGESLFVFASALRILESLDIVPKVMNLRGVTEIEGLGYALDDRTPYVGVAALRAAEILKCSDNRLSYHHYWRWDTIPISKLPESELLVKVHNRFRLATARRLRGDRTAVALLSGGLDSRCVVAFLRMHSAAVYTFNYSPRGTMDQIYGATFAKKVGAVHHETDVRINYPELFKAHNDAWNAAQNRENYFVERPRLIWTGNDGSFTLGHLWLSEDIVSMPRMGKLNLAIDQLLLNRKIDIKRRIFRRKFRRALSLSDVVSSGMREEVDKFEHEDPARNLYIFFMLHNMRKHLGNYFENIDLHGLEMQTPFMDADFLSSILTVPLDFCIRHRFYTKWLYLLDPVVTSVPWQVYPGHEPCPVRPAETMSEEDEDRAYSAWQTVFNREVTAQFKKLLRGDFFFHPLLNMPYLQAAALIHGLEMRDYSYALRTAILYQRYWTACSGRYELPDLEQRSR